MRNRLFLVIALLVGPLLVRAEEGTAVLRPEADTFLSFTAKRSKFGSQDLLRIYGDLSRAIFRFDLSGVPSNVVIKSAELSFTATRLTSDPSTSYRYFCIEDLNTDFDEQSADFVEASSGVPWQAEGMLRGGDFGKKQRTVFLVSDIGTKTVKLDPAVVNAALMEQKRAIGFVLTGTGEGINGILDIRSRETTDENERPKLTLVYSNRMPIARAGDDVLITSPDSVNLSGSASSYRDGSRDGLAFEWVVEASPAGSKWSIGQNAGTAESIVFDCDVPGTYKLAMRAADSVTGEGSTDSVYVTYMPVQAGQHPRLHLNGELLASLRAMRDANDPTWSRFYKFVRSGQTYTNFPFGRTFSYLLAYQVTGDTQFFDIAWANLRKNIYRNGQDNSGGLKPINETWKDTHSAGYIGGAFTAEAAVMYDWGYQALTEDQRRDLIEWLNTAVDYNTTVNGYRTAYFRNDGAAIVHGLAAVAYATFGENPRAGEYLLRFREAWTGVRKALDIMGTGGALAEGNSYGTVPTALNLILTCNLVWYATGEDLFDSHPFFRQRLAYDAFATYPDTPGGPGNAVPSSYPGVPFVEQAAIGGDGIRAFSWHSLNLRPNGLMLARRFAGTEEANMWNWVFRQPRVDSTRDANDSFIDLLFAGPRPELQKPSRLAHFDPSMGYVYIRSSWDLPDATWISFYAGPHLDAHQHLDQGAFSIFKHRSLAPKTGHYDSGSVSSRHQLGWYYRTVSSNGLLIGDPREVMRGFISGMGCDDKGKGSKMTVPDVGNVCIPNDGGQRTMYPVALTLNSVDIYDRYNEIYNTAKVITFEERDGAVIVVADITNAYNSPRYSTSGNSPKVNRVYRRMVYLRDPDLLLIGDTVESTNESFEKKWLIHALERIEVGGNEVELSPGEIENTGTNEAKIVVDDSTRSDAKQTTFDLRSGYGALLLKTVFPASFKYLRVGGRMPADQPHARSNNLHYHTHIKDFWVKDYSEGTYPDHISMNWAPEFPMESQTSAYVPIFGPGYGRWRLEVVPTTPATTDYFLNVLKPTVSPNDSMPQTESIETDQYFGVSIHTDQTSYRVLFPKLDLSTPVIERQ